MSIEERTAARKKRGNSSRKCTLLRNSLIRAIQENYGYSDIKEKYILFTEAFETLKDDCIAAAAFEEENSPEDDLCTEYYERICTENEPTVHRYAVWLSEYQKSENESKQKEDEALHSQMFNLSLNEFEIDIKDLIGMIQDPGCSPAFLKEQLKESDQKRVIIVDKYKEVCKVCSKDKFSEIEKRYLDVTGKQVNQMKAAVIPIFKK